jgi:hypothetical protein
LPDHSIWCLMFHLPVSRSQTQGCPLAVLNQNRFWQDSL